VPSLLRALDQIAHAFRQFDALPTELLPLGQIWRNCLLPLRPPYSPPSVPYMAGCDGRDARTRAQGRSVSITKPSERSPRPGLCRFFPRDVHKQDAPSGTKGRLMVVSGPLRDRDLWAGLQSSAAASRRLGHLGVPRGVLSGRSWGWSKTCAVQSAEPPLHDARLASSAPFVAGVPDFKSFGVEEDIRTTRPSTLVLICVTIERCHREASHR